MKSAGESAWEKAKRGLKCCIESLETCTCSDGCPWEDRCWGESDAPLILPAVKEALKAMEKEEHLIRHASRDTFPCEGKAFGEGPARLMPLEELRTGSGHGWEETWSIGDPEKGEADGIGLAECVWVKGHIMLEDGCTANAHEGPYADGYGRKGGCRVWRGMPTMEQTEETPWENAP